MPKYILDPSGKIKSDSEFVEPNKISNQVLKNYENFFSSRRRKDDIIINPAKNVLPLSISSESQEKNILEKESPIFNEGNIFPNKENIDGNQNLLINSSFGSDESIKYYTPYNSIFSDFDINKNIFAEELEMIAGVELNSLGLILSPKGVDYTKYIYVFDFLIESIVYLTTYWAISLTPQQYDNKISLYFKKLININSEIEISLNPFNLIKYYLVGFDRFINTDPKSRNLTNIINFNGNENVLETIGKYLGRTILSISKIERNRIFLLIRKFQRESYWHSNILFKAKEDSAENDIDKFFIQFNQYYFKFLIERINIGYIVFKSLNLKYKGADHSTRHFDQSRLKSLEKESNKIRMSQNLSEILYSPEFDNNDHYYYWSQKEAIKVSKDKTSITSLPNLLKTNEFFKQKLDKKNKILSSNFSKSKESARRLPNDLVKQIESFLNSEYMPFYLHDLRTNEIVSMHAFLESITDTFNPKYNSSTGYGRIDEVQQYVSTSRNISVTFTLSSLNSTDFDLMWYQINKIVSMVYPQWSQGIPATTGEFKDKFKDFKYPFTQVPTASPLIRLRIGDVIKSNYNIDSIKKLHGNKYKKERTVRILEDKRVINVNSEKKAYVLKSRFDEGIGDFFAHKIYYFLENKYIDPFNENFYEFKEQKPVSESLIIDEFYDERLFSKEIDANASIIDNEVFTLEKVSTNDFAIKFGLYKLSDRRLYDILKRNWVIYHFKIKLNPDNSLDEGYFFYRNIDITQNVIDTTTLYKDTIDNSVFSPEDENGNINNPYTKAFETTSGEGLAGFITNLDVQYQDSMWNTNKPGKNAPKSVKISMSFTPIHDIPLGINYDGSLRSPAYNVGDINNSLFMKK